MADDLTRLAVGRYYYPMGKEVWIIGGGTFGLRAAESMNRSGQNDLLVIEKSPSKCRELPARGIPCVCDDGVRFLVEHLTRPKRNLWVVAAAPLHVAFEWAAARLAPTATVVRLPVPESITARLPNLFRGHSGDVYASNADFICPPNCSEAGRVCTVTGRKRPRIMHAFIAGLAAEDVKILVVRSFQLAAGVGGLRATDLHKIWEEIRTATGPILLATACRCHAVLTCLEISTG
jgi:hypothetical protein